MQKTSSNAFSRSFLCPRVEKVEKENVSQNSNAVINDLKKYKKMYSQISTNADSVNNRSFANCSENSKAISGNKSQELLAKEFKRPSNVAKNIERKAAKATTVVLRDNTGVVNNLPSSKPTTSIAYYDNFLKKNQEKTSTSSNSGLFPSILETLQLNSSAQSPEPSNATSYSDSENAKLGKYYAKDIMDVLIIKDSLPPKNFLEFHKIPYNLRSRMIDWMVEVLFSYKCQDQTFFLAVSIMDSFFRNSKICYEIGEMHLVGVTAMFIASKYEEIYPFKLKLVYEKIGHKKIPIEEIKKKEQEILEVLNFSLLHPTPNEFTNLAIQILHSRVEIKRKAKIHLEKVCNYLLKMVLHDYDIISKINYHVIAASTIFVAFKIIENIDPSFKSESMAKEIKKIFNISDSILFDSATKILYLAKNFEKLYPNLENLKKFNGFTPEKDKKPI